jgi:uncharacterized protein YecT (DUF1311 family)
MEASGGVTVEIHNCIGEEYERQDALLNSYYKTLMAQLNDERKIALRDAQRAWVSYRDANCGFYAHPDGGTLATISAASCGLKLTAERAEEVRLLVNDNQ